MKRYVKYGIKTIHREEDIKTKRNIAYFNFRCNRINAIVHKKAGTSNTEIEGIKIWKDLIIQCKKALLKEC